MANRIYLVRHGLTPWNKELRFQGYSDIELHTEGVKQARAAQKKLASQEIQAFFSSDLKRALKTATIIAEPHKLRVKAYKGLREINLGLWEGLTKEYLVKNYPQLVNTWYKSPHLFSITQGESFAAVQQRSLQTFREILINHPVGNLVIVAHGGVLAALISGILQKPLANMWQFKTDNAAITTLIRADGRIFLDSFNDISHLNKVS